MKSYKELLNSAAYCHPGLRELDDEELKAMKRCLLDMYKHIAYICESNNLVLMLTGGSCLGAVRHQGFIPWDDDLDLMMPRKDYNKFLSLCESGCLGKDYEYTYPSKRHDSPCAFLKIYHKETQIIGIEDKHPQFPTGVFVDIFPVEGASNIAFVRKCKGAIANTIRLIMNVVEESGRWSDMQKELYSSNKFFYRYMKLRQITGYIFSIISHKTWVRLYDSFVSEEKIGQYAVIPTGRKLYGGETLPSDVYFPASDGIFEGLEVKLPAKPDKYLRNLYGDYMKIPPIEKRERHIVSELKLPKRYYSE